MNHHDRDRHEWISKSGKPWSQRVRSDDCRVCGCTPDCYAHGPIPVSEVARDLLEQWEIEPGDWKYEIEPRYRREAWWFSNEKGDSIFVEPKDVADLIDLAVRVRGPE